MRPPPRMYDVCLSFAFDTREFVENVAKRLEDAGLRVFYDQFRQNEIWGDDLFHRLEEVYKENSKYCIVFASKQYASRHWPKRELRSALERERRAGQPYILPVLMEENMIDVEGLELPSRSWVNGLELGAQQVAIEIIRKV